MQILLISSTQFADSTGVDMYYICAQRVVAAAANAPDATPRSASDFISCTSALDLTCKLVLLIAMLIVCSTANAQFCAESFDGVIAPAMPEGWTAYVATGTVAPWIISTSSPDTPPNAAFAADPSNVTDNLLVSPLTIVTASNSMFYFRHSYKTEPNFDGGVLEISINDGGFTDIVTAGGSFSLNGYNSTISSSFMSPVAGRMAWSGDSGGFITTGVTLPPAALGNFAQLRWRAASDSSGARTGWVVDSILCGPAPEYWSLAAPYPIAVAGHAMTTVGNTLYSFGGISGTAETASAYRFNGTAWTPIAPLPMAVAYASAVSDGEYAYIIGGASATGPVFTTAYRYNPITNSYTSISPSPTARWTSAAAYLNGNIYKIGGSNATSGGSATDAVEVYHIDTDTWSTASPYPLGITFASAFARGQFVYVAGGTNSSKAYRYDPVSNVWDDAAFADLPQARQGAASANFHSTFILAGGYLGNSQTAEASALKWRPDSNTWETLPNMLLRRARISGGIVNGCFFAVGGESAGNAFSNQNQKLECLFYNGFER